jgi:hypothetical protein
MQSSADEASARERRQASALPERLLFPLVGLLSIFLIAQLLDYGYGRDQAIYSVVADTLLQGGAPYRDAWDFKPPGIYFGFALARGLFGSGFQAVRILEALGLVSLFAAFGIFSRRHLGAVGAGILGAGVAILAYVPLEFWYTAQPEGFGAVALAWALVCASYEPRGAAGRRVEWRRFAAWSGAAALYGVAALLKPPLGGGILVSFAFVVVARWRAAAPSRRAQALGAPTLAFALGGVLPLLATVAYFGAVGALGDLYEALFVFTPGYTALAPASQDLAGSLWRALHEWLLRSAPYNAVGLVPLLLLPALHARERAAVAHVLGVIAFSLLGVALQAKFFLYHYAAAIALTGLLAGWGYWKVWIRVRRSAPGLIAAGAVLALVALHAIPGLPSIEPFWKRTEKRIATLRDPARRDQLRDSLYSLGDVDAASNRAAARWLARNTPSGSSLFIWGFEPVIYQLSARRPASRYIHNVPQRSRWGKQQSRRLLIQELEASQPAAIIVVHRDSLPWVTGDPLDSAQTLEDFPELRELLETRYRPAERIRDLEIRLRKDL